MNSKTVQSTETWTEIARLFARSALGASFLSAVSDRFGLWGATEQRTPVFHFVSHTLYALFSVHYKCFLLLYHALLL